LQCRGQPATTEPEESTGMRFGRRRSSGLFFEGNRLFELQHAPSSGSEAEGEASENPEVQAKPSPEGEDPENSASQSESLSENEMDQQQMEALFSDNGRLARLTAIQQISSGRHEFLFRVLVKRPSPSSSKYASTPILAKTVTHKFSEAFQISTGIFTNPAQSMAGEEEEGVSFSTSKEKVIGTLTEVARLRPDQMVAALGECDLPSEWPSGGLFDCFLMIVLEPHLKEMRVAVDAAFTKPYGDFEEEEAEGEDNDDDQNKDEEPEANEDQDSKPKVPMAPAHFIQKRRFLRRWRFEELLQQDLKNGIVLAACMRGAGANPLFLPTFDFDVEALCTLGGPGGSATVEVLPAGALRPSWWIALMGNSVDLPRPHASSDNVIPAMNLPL